MNIAFINFTSAGIRDPRGTKIAASLAEKGHNVTWVYGEDMLCTEVPGVSFQRIGTPALPFRAKEITFAFAAAAWTRKQGFDIVIGFSHIGGVAAYLACRGTRTPFVFDYPDPLYPSDPAYASFYSWQDRWLARGFEVLEKKALNAAAFVAVISPFFAREVHRQYGVKKNRMLVAPNAPDASRFTPTQNKYRTFTLAYTGKAIPEYGLDWLLKAFAFKPQGKLLLVVKTEPAWRNWLQKEIKAHGLKKRVKVYENVPPAKVASLVRRAHAAVFPYPRSQINDHASPNKFFEYLALGLPIISRDLPEARRMIEEGGFGVIVRSADEFKHAIARLIEQPRQTQVMARRARQTALKCFDWRIIAADYEARIREAKQKENH